jgi:predicted nuclease of predicted toxin-antitoxin system
MDISYEENIFWSSRVIKWLLNTTVSNMQASDVPSERIWDKQIVKKTDNKGTIIVKRDSGFLGSACLAVFILTEILLLTLAQEKK